jgi:hypothetical protein
MPCGGQSKLAPPFADCYLPVAPFRNPITGVRHPLLGSYKWRTILVTDMPRLPLVHATFTSVIQQMEACLFLISDVRMQTTAGGRTVPEFQTFIKGQRCVPSSPSRRPPTV